MNLEKEKNHFWKFFSILLQLMKLGLAKVNQEQLTEKSNLVRMHKICNLKNFSGVVY